MLVDAVALDDLHAVDAVVVAVAVHGDRAEAGGERRAAEAQRLVLGDDQVAVFQHFDVYVKALPVELLALGLGRRRQQQRRQEKKSQDCQEKGFLMLHKGSCLWFDVVHG